MLSCPIVQTSSLSSPPIVPLTPFQGRFWLMRWVSGRCLSRLVFGWEIMKSFLFYSFVSLVVGMGKTLQALALIMGNPAKGISYDTPIRHKFSNSDGEVAKTTLIVRYPSERDVICSCSPHTFHINFVQRFVPRVSSPTSRRRSRNLSAPIPSL